VWGGHSLRLRSGQALSAAFEVDVSLRLRESAAIDLSYEPRRSTF
jgi:hypothetical protein